MAILIRFTAPGLTAAKYAEVLERLERAQEGSPAGRSYHVCFGDEENLRFADVWDSREHFEDFKKTLEPILNDLGIGLDDLEVVDVRNFIVGERFLFALRRG